MGAGGSAVFRFGILDCVSFLPAWLRVTNATEGPALERGLRNPGDIFAP
jgi:hypothetical protein